MKVKVLIEQRAQPGADRGYLPSGEVVDIDNEWAAELLNRGDAELAEAPKPVERAEKRPSTGKSEKR